MKEFDYFKNGITQKYAEFTGRSRRSEFWYFVLFNFLISLAISFVSYTIGLSIIETVYSLAVLVPSLAVGARRLHDTNRSAWWLLIGLIPLVGVIVLIVFWVQDSDEGANQFGANPKGVGSDIEIEDHLV